MDPAELGTEFVCWFYVTLSLSFLEQFEHWVFTHIYNKMMSPSQIGFC